MKVYNTQVVFREFPGEITLALNITECPFNCEGCHSPHLRESIGEELTKESLRDIINRNPGITCVGIMGGDRDIKAVEAAARYIKEHSDLKVGWYSGYDSIPDVNLVYFDYIKIGHWDESKGPLTSPTTNQKLYDISTMSVINHRLL